jgi:hypothetical protein
MTSHSRADFEAFLASSSAAVCEAIDAVGEWTAHRDELLASLYEHEVMHEGQIIRHMYALQKTLPSSWRWA